MVWVESFDNVQSHSEVERLLSHGEALIQERCPERSDIARQQSIAAWREAYSRMALKPNRYPCATEQLMRRLVDGQRVPRISALVDLCNATALRFMIPVAPFDLAGVEKFCQVRFAAGNERFRAINADQTDEIPESEVIFADDSSDVISRRWAWRQSDKGKITPETERVAIVAEAVDANARDVVQQAGEILVRQLRQLLNARARIDALDQSSPRSYLNPDARH